MRLALKTTEQLEERYKRLSNLHQLNCNNVIRNALNRDEPASHVAAFYQELANRNNKARQRIRRELDSRYRKQEAIA